MKQRQRGVALITVMLIVVVATVLSVQMASEQNLTVRRATSQFDASQARQYAFGGEELARQILHEDFVEQPMKDTLAEPWSSPELVFEFEGGQVEIRIEDLQGRINVNGLVDGGAAVVTGQRLVALATLLGVDPVFVDRIRDWVDANDVKGALGAEDFDYLGLETPYRAADQAMVDLSELRLILEMNDEVYQALVPYLSAIPVPGVVINLNTAPAGVLAAVSPSLTLDMAEGLVAQRDQQQGYESIQDFLPQLPAQGMSSDLLGVQSAFFQVSVRARYGERYAYLTSVIQRDPADGSMRVIYRDISRKVYPVQVALDG
ncbi:MAG: type II secretion system minor pseudopilin GspK [Pseudomonadota bacterium]